MKELEKNTEDYKEIGRLLFLNKMNTTEAAKMQTLFKIYVQENAKICLNCPAQVRFMHKRFKSFYENFNIDQLEKDLNNVSKLDNLKNNIIETIDDLNLTKVKVLKCVNCGKELINQQKKYCGLKCKKEFKTK